MAAGARWIDLLDPSPSELEAKLPAAVHARALEQLLAPAMHDDEPRPKLEPQGDYVFGVLLVPVLVRDDDEVFYQEIDLVITRETIVTVRKTPEGGRPPWHPGKAQESCREEDNVAMIAYHLIDDVAERFLDLVDGVNDAIDDPGGSRRELAVGADPDAPLGAPPRHAPHPAHACPHPGRRP